jgi:hypothetical protein
LPNGTITGLELTANEALVVHDDDGVPDSAPYEFVPPRPPIQVLIQDWLTMEHGSVLRLLFEADAWDSLITFEPGINVEFGGALELTFHDDVDVATQVGRTLRIFDWTGVSPNGQFQIQSPYVWDLTNLYTTGEVTLISVPEPSTLVLGGMVLLGLFVWRRKTSCLLGM